MLDPHYTLTFVGARLLEAQNYGKSEQRKKLLARAANTFALEWVVACFRLAFKVNIHPIIEQLVHALECTIQ